MPLINVHDKSRMPIKFLWQLIFTFTFDKKSTGHMTKDIIGQQLVKWNGFIQINKERRANELGIDPVMANVPVGLKGDVIDEMEYQLGLMCSWVVREEKGEFEKRVETYKKHKIDFRLVEPMCHVFPEFSTKRNLRKGAEALKKAMEDHPNDYGINKKKRWTFSSN